MFARTHVDVHAGVCMYVCMIWLNPNIVAVSKFSFSAFLRSPAHQEMDSSTDTAIVYLDVPAQQAGCLDALQKRLRALPGIYEIAVAQSTGSHVRASLTGTAQALYDAQKRLRRAVGPGVTIARLETCDRRDGGVPEPYRPRVHIVLAPGGPGSTPEPRPTKTELAVLGPYSSGTHAEVEYCSKYFRVHVEPVMRRRNDGNIMLDGRSLWKHTVPMEPLWYPSGTRRGPVTFMLTVRHILSWLVSLSERPFDLLPVPRATRRYGDLRWLLRPVVLEQNDREGAHPFGCVSFPSAVHLWAKYVQGYLAGDLAPGLDRERVLVVRHEDLLRCPSEVMDALEQAGLQRNNVPFEPIAQLTTGYGIRSREETMAREAAGVAAIPDDVKATVRGLLVAIGCEPELRALNYIWWSTTPAANAGSAPTPKLIVESARMRARTSTPAKAQCPWLVPVLQTLDSPERRVLQTAAAAARDADFIPHRKKRPRADVDNRHDGDVEWAQHPELAQNELLADTTPSRCARRVLQAATAYRRKAATTSAEGIAAALAQNEVLADTTPSRGACDAAHHQQLDDPMTAAEEAKAEEVRSRMSAFLDSTDLDTMFLRTFAVGSGTPGAARHDGTVKEERPDVELRSLPSDGMDSDGALPDIVAEVPADRPDVELRPLPSDGIDTDGAVRDIVAEAPADQEPKANSEVTSLTALSQDAAGLRRARTPEVGLVTDIGEQAQLYAPGGSFEDAYRMGAADWCPAHLNPVSPEGQDVLFEVLRQRGIRIPALPDLGKNKDLPVLIWTSQYRRRDGAPYWAWLPRCSGGPPGSGLGRRR